MIGIHDNTAANPHNPSVWAARNGVLESAVPRGQISAFYLAAARGLAATQVYIKASYPTLPAASKHPSIVTTPRLNVLSPSNRVHPAA